MFRQRTQKLNPSLGVISPMVTLILAQFTQYYRYRHDFGIIVKLNNSLIQYKHFWPGLYYTKRAIVYYLMKNRHFLLLTRNIMQHLLCKNLPYSIVRSLNFIRLHILLDQCMVLFLRKVTWHSYALVSCIELKIASQNLLTMRKI